MLTAYDDKEDAETSFAQLRSSLPSVAQSPDGAKIIQKFAVLGKTATTEANFNDMVKIIWRVVKPMNGAPMHRLALFFLAIGAVVDSLAKGSLAETSKLWLPRLEKWLGTQLTIGGKGVAGEGEGKVVERVQRFFSTPYLHDYD